MEHSFQLLVYFYNHKSILYLYFFISFLGGLSKELDTCNQHNLPDLVWLLRDIDQDFVDGSDEPISATEYVHYKLQKSATSGAGSSVRHHFPSLNCLTLPPPSCDPEIMSNIITNADKLTSSFNNDLQSAIQYILANIRVKQVYNSKEEIDGNLLACLIQQFYNLLSASHGKLPSLHMISFKALRADSIKRALALVAEYESDMRSQLDGKLPIDDGLCGGKGETLMNIHHQVFAKKSLELRKYILRYQPRSPSNCPSTLEIEAISVFQDRIVKFDTILLTAVVGGLLLDFINQNMKASEEYCASLYRSKYSEIVGVKIRSILFNRIPDSITDEKIKFECEYMSEARGPAISKIFDLLTIEKAEQEAELQLIPGSVSGLRVVGADSNRVKLRWLKPRVNPSAAEHYEIMVKSKGVTWKTVATYKRLSAIVTGLKSSTWYCFLVRAKNDRYCAEEVRIIQVLTLMSRPLQMVSTVGAVLAPPVVLPSLAAYAGYRRVSESERNNTHSRNKLHGLLLIRQIPNFALGGFIPVLGSATAYLLNRSLIKGVKGELNGTAVEESEEATCADNLVGNEALGSCNDLVDDSTVDDYLVDLPINNNNTGSDGSNENLNFIHDLEDSADEN